MIETDDLAAIPLFAGMEPALLARIAGRAGDVRVGTGDYVMHEGDPAAFWVLLSGEVETIRKLTGVERQVTTFDPGEFFGEVPLMIGTAAFGTVRALRPSRLARIDAVDFHAMVSTSEFAGAELARTLMRRVGVIETYLRGTDVVEATIVGDPSDLRCHDVRDFLSRNHIVFEWLDPLVPSDLAAIPPDVLDLERPVVITARGTRLVAPSRRDLATALDLQTQPHDHCYDLAIVGGGPAGLAAAVYGGSEGLRTVMIEREAPGGQAGTSSRIENYLGFPGGISGDDLADRALRQARRFGTEIIVTRTVERIDGAEEHQIITLDGGEILHARAIVVASGVTWRRLHLDGAERLVGRGIYYGAARTEALGVRGKNVFLIGGGNSAGQAAVFFANYAECVTLLIRADDIAKGMSHYLIEQLRAKTNVRIETSTRVTAVGGEEALATIETTTNGAPPRTRQADALFVFIGADAETSWLPEAIERDARGYLKTGRDVCTWSLERAPYALETSVPGIFAVGDVRSESVKRVASGVGEGSMTVAYVHQFLANRDVAGTEAPALVL